MEDTMPGTINELRSVIDRSWSAWNAALDRLTEAQWASLRDEQGWTIVDHIGHIANWERSVAYFLRGLPRHEALGVEEALYLKGDEDATNAAIQLQTRELSRDQMQAQARVDHADVLRLLESLDDDQLGLPYRHFLPDEPGDGDGPPAVKVIVNKTADHYVEHLRWLEALIRRA